MMAYISYYQKYIERNNPENDPYTTIRNLTIAHIIVSLPYECPPVRYIKKLAF